MGLPRPDGAAAGRRNGGAVVVLVPVSMPLTLINVTDGLLEIVL
jgi:hypothetical protein